MYIHIYFMFMYMLIYGVLTNEIKKKIHLLIHTINVLIAF